MPIGFDTDKPASIHIDPGSSRSCTPAGVNGEGARLRGKGNKDLQDEQDGYLLPLRRVNPSG